MGGICHKADKVKVAERKEKKAQLSLTADGTSKIVEKKLGDTHHSKKKQTLEESSFPETKLMAGLSKKAQTPGDSGPIVEYIKLSEKATDKFDSKLYRTDIEGDQSDRSLNAKGISSFVKFSTVEGRYALGDLLFCEEGKCLEVYQCFSELSGKLFTLKLVNVP